MPNKFYSKNMVPTDFWKSIKKIFNWKDSVKRQNKFYTSNKSSLWIDLRTFPDDKIHGNGLELNNTCDGVKLEITRKVGGTRDINCYMFVIADAFI